VVRRFASPVGLGHPADVRFVGSLLVVLDAQLDVVAALGADELAVPSMCPGWTVEDVLAHSVGITLKFAEFAAGRTDAPHAPEVMIDRAEPARAVASAREAAQVAWPAADATRLCTLPFGVFSAELAAGINLVDALAHTWDMAQALGRTVPCRDRVWTEASVAADAVVPAGASPHYAAARSMPGGTPPPARFLARVGRSAGERHRPRAR
jgi:uncharacterized protein (TIGR03086 family)